MPVGIKSGRATATAGNREHVIQNPTPEIVWYGWDGGRLTTSASQTVYLPRGFTPLLRIETENAELAKTPRRCLADKLQQDGNIAFPAELISRLDMLERELHQNAVSEENRQWLAGCGLTVEQMAKQMEPFYEPDRKIHLYHCDHRGLPLALFNENGAIAWCAEYDEWGNQLNEDNPENLQQLIRLPGQQYDEETGLHYNRYRYYDPRQGRYITQDPIGLRGGWNFYQYTTNPMNQVDPMGLDTLVLVGGATDGNPIGHTAMAFTGDGVYSYGTSHDFGSNTSEYLEDQAKYRHTTVYRLNTTPDQEQEMKKYINRNYFNKSDYNIVSHNCATMVSEALSQADIAQDAMIYLISQGMHPELPPTIGAVMMMAGYKGTLLNQHDSISTDFSEFNHE